MCASACSCSPRASARASIRAPSRKSACCRSSSPTTRRDDAVFADLPNGLLTLQWHGDTFELPDGAVRLAGSPAYANQAFRFEAAYGVQFHLEVTPELAREWAAVPEYAASLERTLGAGAATGFLRSIEAGAEEMTGHGRALFERWLDHVVEPAARARTSLARP